MSPKRHVIAFIFLLKCLRLTWKCGLETHRAIFLKSGSITFWNWAGSITSRISSISPRNITWKSKRAILNAKKKSEAIFIIARLAVRSSKKFKQNHENKALWIGFFSLTLQKENHSQSRDQCNKFCGAVLQMNSQSSFCRARTFLKLVHF